MSGDTIRGVYPGSFDPPTIAHVAIAEAAMRVGALARLDLAISRVTLGKDAGTQRPLAARVALLERLTHSRPWLHVVVTDAQLVADIAAGYDVVVMGADKWAQVRDPAWYHGSTAARDAAIACLARVLVAPRPGFEIVGADALDLPEFLAGVSSTAARAGNTDLIALECRPERHDA
jgi:nicotinic acid mononucleotide adenylyltransferase